MNNSLLACKFIFNKRRKYLILSQSMCVSLSEPYLMENYTSLAEVDNIFMWKLMVIVMIHGLMDGSHSTAVMLIDSRISRTVCTITISILLSSNHKGFYWHSTLTNILRQQLNQCSSKILSNTVILK